MALPHLTFIVQATVCRALFTAAILASLHHGPVVSYRNYPPAVQERMRARPEYADQIPTDAKTVGRKIAAAFVIATALATASWLAGAREAASALAWSLGPWSTVNLRDALVIDTLWFCRGWGYRLPGTEDREAEYRKVGRHRVDFLKGEVIGGLAVSLAAAGLIAPMGFVG